MLKPPVAKISDIFGRAQTYLLAVALYIISYILCATARHFDQYAGSYIVYCIGQTSMQILNQLIVADITTARWRGLANALVNLPFLVTPLVAAFLADAALKSVGWRWGVGMFGIIMPVCAGALIVPLWRFQQRMLQQGVNTRIRTSHSLFLSQIDGGGMVLLSGGFALLLLPMALAGTTPSRWSTPWVPALIAIDAALLIALPFYESRVAKTPLVPIQFLRNISLVLVWIMGVLDSFAFSVTYTYMYAWATVVHSYSARDATILVNTAGCSQVLIGLVAGFLMWKTRHYKWILAIGVSVRLVGYGVMIRLRGANNGAAEVFIVQFIQGFGSGIIQTILLVVAQVVVPRSELSQSTALELLIIYMGNALGSTAAGAIYTNSLKNRLYFHYPLASSQDVETVFNTLGENAYPVGSPARDAINHAYSDVLRYMTFAALAASIGGVLLVWLLPDLRLSDRHNLAGRSERESHDSTSKRSCESGLARWWRTGRIR